MSDLTGLTIAEARDGLKKKAFSAKELTEAHIKAIEKARALNAFVTETPDIARAGAAEADKRIAAGSARALEGIPLGIKDLFCTKGVLTTAGSHILDGFKPPYESTVSRNLFEAGAVMLGKLNMDEFAMGSSNETSYYKPVINPWRRKGSNTALVPGGSSGGSSASVAARLVMGATGTDTGGSIRQPAAVTGIAGIKPTYGRCSRWGIVAFASSLDQAGPMARTVRDCAILLKTMASHDPLDSTSVDLPVPDYEAAMTGNVKGLRVGIPKEYRIDGMPVEIEALWQQGIQWLKDAGAETVDVSLPHTKYALPAYYIVAPAEHARGGVRARGAAAHFDRHVCALGRVLRRLLHQSAEAAHVDRARLRGSLQEVRCAADADGAGAGVWDRREDGRSDLDVSERRVHGDGEPCGVAGDFGAGRVEQRGLALGAPAHRQGVRRGDAVSRG
jgi:aspartyl-tRNA(Asn)/glutamyl-tRNA(Gln) amidotransferase subunit A